MSKRHIATILFLLSATPRVLAEDAAPVQRGISADGTAIATATTAVREHHLDVAVTTLRAAISVSPANAQLRYLLGEVLRLQNENAAALDAFQAAKLVADESTNFSLQARILQAIAETFERTPGKMTDARAAWSKLMQLATAHPDAASVDIPRARIQAIDVFTEQDATYADVRHRIEERERHNNHAH